MKQHKFDLDSSEFFKDEKILNILKNTENNTLDETVEKLFTFHEITFNYLNEDLIDINNDSSVFKQRIINVESFLKKEPSFSINIEGFELSYEENFLFILFDYLFTLNELGYTHEANYNKESKIDDNLKKAYTSYFGLDNNICQLRIDDPLYYYQSSIIQNYNKTLNQLLKIFGEYENKFGLNTSHENFLYSILIRNIEDPSLTKQADSKVNKRYIETREERKELENIFSDIYNENIKKIKENNLVLLSSGAFDKYLLKEEKNKIVNQLILKKTFKLGIEIKGTFAFDKRLENDPMFAKPFDQYLEKLIVVKNQILTKTNLNANLDEKLAKEARLFLKNYADYIERVKNKDPIALKMTPLDIMKFSTYKKEKNILLKEAYNKFNNKNIIKNILKEVNNNDFEVLSSLVYGVSKKKFDEYYKENVVKKHLNKYIKKEKKEKQR